MHSNRTAVKQQYCVKMRCETSSLVSRFLIAPACSNVNNWPDLPTVTHDRVRTTVSPVSHILTLILISV